MRGPAGADYSRRWSTGKAHRERPASRRGVFELVDFLENRLVSASGAGNTVAYAYDAQGRRKSKTVNGRTTVYVTDADDREVLEYGGATGQTQAWYAYGLGPNDVLSRSNGSSNSRQTLIPDIQGSFIGTLDSGGTLTKRGFRPYGESASTAGSFAYTGQIIDPETSGLYYYRARMYSPGIRRFLQTDPIGYIGGFNLYLYAGNDPINGLDPTGLATQIYLGYTYAAHTGQLAYHAYVLLVDTITRAQFATRAGPTNQAFRGAGGIIPNGFGPILAIAQAYDNDFRDYNGTQLEQPIGTIATDYAQTVASAQQFSDMTNANAIL